MEFSHFWNLRKIHRAASRTLSEMPDIPWLLRVLKVTALNHIAVTLAFSLVSTSVNSSLSSPTHNLTYTGALSTLSTSDLLKGSIVPVKTIVDLKEVRVISQLLQEIAEGELRRCHAVLLTQTQVDSLILRLVQKKLLFTSQPFIVFDIESFSKGQHPDAPQFKSPASNTSILYCIVYYLLAPIQQVEEALATIPKLDWFPGSVPYFVTYTGQPLYITDLERSSTILSAYNTLFISLIISSVKKLWPVKLMSNCPFCRSGEPEIILKNLWSPTGGFKWKSDGGLFPELFFDCNGHKLRGVAMPLSPFIDYTEGNATHPIVLKDCFHKDIIVAVSEFCNFTFDIYEPADGQWGYQSSNGSFTGVLGDVERYLADFSLGIAIAAEREQVADFTITFFTGSLAFTTSKPKPLPQWLSLVRPYQLYVWICFLVAVLAAGPIYWLILRPSGYSISLLAAAFIMFASLINQSCHWPKRTSGRMFSIFWILFSMVATMSYLSNLTAFMTVPALSPTVDSLEELSSPFSPFSWGILDIRAADYQLFEASQAPVYQRTFRGLTFCSSGVECVQKVVDEQFAFISWRTYLRGLIASHFTEKNGYTPVYLSKESFYPVNIAYALQKGSPLKRCFDVGLRRLVEGGFIETWLTNIMQRNTLESQRKKRDESTSREENNGEAEGALSLKLHHLQGVFFIYVVGMMLSFVLLISEMVSSTARNKKTGFLST